MQIAKDTVVTIDYKLTDNQGTVLDASGEGDPLAYIHGGGHLIPGLESALEGKAEGDDVQVVIPPEKAYGVRDENLVQKVERERFGEGTDVQVGMRFQVQGQAGPFVVTVVGVEPDQVTLDANHPLAGTTLHFEVNVVGVRAATAEELEHGHAHGPGGHDHQAPLGPRGSPRTVKLEVLPDPGTVALRAARWLAERARAAVAARGRCLLALSGGRTPGPMLTALAGEDVPWSAMHLFQVDERVAPAGDRDRNLDPLRERLLDRVALPAENLHAMPVEERDLEAAAAGYARELSAVAGAPAVLDAIHLGLGRDGHTASLVPGDPVLAVTDRDVAVTAPYSGRRRMTLTLPVLDRARAILWVVTGVEKAAVLPRLVAGDASVPAGRVRRERAVVIADAAAAAGLPPPA